MDRSPAVINFPQFLLSRWQAFLAEFGRSGAALLVTLVLLFSATLVFMDEAEEPWGKTVQKRLVKGQPLRAQEHAIIGLWWGALIAAGTTALLVITARRWMPSPTFAQAESATASKGRPAVLLILTAGALGLGTWERLPRMDHSLWNDEEYAMRSYAHGEWELQKDGTRAFEPVTWTDTLFDNSHGNNHLLNSLVMRGALTVWRSFSHAPREAFSEVALRVPSLIAGVLTIGLMVWLGVEMGRPWVGAAAAFLLALSPWHLHYATDAKGYAMMLFFIALNILSISRALRGGKLRWWLLFSISEAAYLLSFAGSLYVAIMVNLVAAIQLLRSEPRTRLLTLIGFNLLATIPVVWWMLPSVPQLLIYLRNPEGLHVGMDINWVRDVFSALFAGWSYDNPHPGQHVGSSWLLMKKACPWFLPAFALGVMPLLAVAGFVRAFKHGTAGLAGIVGLIMAAVAAYSHNLVQQTPMVVWYLLYLLIAFAFILPLGLAFQSRRLPWLSPAFMAAFVVAYGVLIWDANERHRFYDRQPLRQTVAHIRSQSPAAVTAVFGVSDKQTRSYDPFVKVLRSLPDLQLAIAEARDRQLPLYVYYCGDSETTKRHPEIMQRLKSSDGGFEFLKMLPGLEELFSYRIYRLK